MSSLITSQSSVDMSLLTTPTRNGTSVTSESIDLKDKTMDSTTSYFSSFSPNSTLSPMGSSSSSFRSTMSSSVDQASRLSSPPKTLRQSAAHVLEDVFEDPAESDERHPTTKQEQQQPQQQPSSSSSSLQEQQVDDGRRQQQQQQQRRRDPKQFSVAEFQQRLKKSNSRLWEARSKLRSLVDVSESVTREQDKVREKFNTIVSMVNKHSDSQEENNNNNNNNRADATRQHQQQHPKSPSRRRQLQPDQSEPQQQQQQQQQQQPQC